uniref:Uncharacterized protein n=1 Tax=Candidatus Nitrotoga fabula TaxID=2182327 RepID=A0A2X0SJN3_9PROT|nr:protein of unknown function [Candidatus Nitrotoga fabula]
MQTYLITQIMPKVSCTSQNSKLNKQNTGTAFFVSREGHALTIHHVVNACKEIHMAGYDGIVNLIPYKTGGGFFSREKSNADIAEEARKWTVIVECWR